MLGRCKIWCVNLHAVSDYSPSWGWCQCIQQWAGIFVLPLWSGQSNSSLGTLQNPLNCIKNRRKIYFPYYLIFMALLTHLTRTACDVWAHLKIHFLHKHKKWFRKMHINVDKNPQEYILILHKPSISERHTLFRCGGKTGRTVAHSWQTKPQKAFR